MDKLYEDSETGCCPRFNTEPWDEEEVKWEERLFLKNRVKSFFHIPLNFGRVMVRNMDKIKHADALADEPVMLSDENSIWGADVYIAVSKEVPQVQMEKLSGTFLTKVFEGPYKDAGKWARQMREYVKSKGRDLTKLYFFYTTCPRCAKYYGKNYTVMVAQV
jgi:hypothetical protein